MSKSNQSVKQILNQLMFHEITKYEAEEMLNEMMMDCAFPKRMVEMNVEYVAYTAANDHGHLHLTIPYQYSKIKHIKLNDKVLIIKKP